MKWTLKWFWCVEMTHSSRPGKWLPMYGRCDKYGPLVDVEREVAIEKASKLPRHEGNFSYRVRPLRPRPAP